MKFYLEKEEKNIDFEIGISILSLLVFNFTTKEASKVLKIVQFIQLNRR